MILPLEKLHLETIKVQTKMFLQDYLLHVLKLESDKLALYQLQIHVLLRMYFQLINTLILETPVAQLVECWA